ncbi:MFS transporter [Myxococcus faecalis]|uniref:MFS transporter n=1 Tax=Myxococcus TaxID=32 RepID=UPI001CBADBFD
MSLSSLANLPSFRAFRHREFLAVWSGALVSNVGTWMEVLALGVFVTKVTGRAEWTGGVAALTYLPSLILSPLGGALADRFDRRKYVAVCAASQALLAGVLATLAFTGSLTVQAVAGICFLNGCVHVLSGPAYTALVAGLVAKEDLHSAMTLMSAQFNLGRIVGPVLAAGLLAAGNVAWVMVANTLSFFAVLFAVAQVRAEPRASLPASSRGLWGDILEGARLARGDSGIRLSMVALFLLALFISPFIALVPVFALQVFGADASAASVLIAVQGVGALVASGLVGGLAVRWGKDRVVDLSMMLMGPVTMAYWLSPTLPVAMGSMFVLGAVYLVVMTGLSTRNQERAPRELQGRVSSLAMMLVNVGYSVGVWAQGALADRVSVRGVTATAAALFFLSMVGLRWQRPRTADVAST